MSQPLPSDSKARKEYPIASGVLEYFPNAIAEVAHISYIGNIQHNPGQPLHWDRSKSSDHTDCIARHLVQRGTIDSDGLRHSAKLAWRALANLQLELEASRDLVSPPVNAQEGEWVDGPASIVYCPSTPVDESLGRPEVPVCYPNDCSDEPYQGHYEPEEPETQPTYCGCPIDYVDKLDPYVRLEAPGTAGDRPRFEFFSDIPKDGQSALARRLLSFFETYPDGVCETFYGGTLVLPDNRRDTARPLSLTERQKAAHEISDIYDLSVPVAYEITGGITTPGNHQAVHDAVYIAGPMRNHPEYNFPAFDAARDRFVGEGYLVINPADMDRAVGIDNQTVTSDIPSYEYVRRDAGALIALVLNNGAIAMLPGWEASTGAVAEFFVARWLGLRVLNAETGRPLNPYDVSWGELERTAIEYLNAQYLNGQQENA